MNTDIIITNRENPKLIRIDITNPTFFLESNIIKIEIDDVCKDILNDSKRLKLRIIKQFRNNLKIFINLFFLDKTIKVYPEKDNYFRFDDELRNSIKIELGIENYTNMDYISIQLHAC